MAPSPSSPSSSPLLKLCPSPGSLTVTARDPSTGAVLGERIEVVNPFDGRVVTSLPALGAGARAELEVVMRDASGAAVHRQCADVASDTAPAPAPALSLDETLGGPLHASCRLQWMFSDQHCGNVSNALVGAIKDMSGPCNASTSKGERCLYSLESVNASSITCTHATPVHKYVDDLSFELEQDGTTCTVHGFSTSELWIAHYDMGTNRCSLLHLAMATGLPFTEHVKASECTQLKSANCDKY